LRPDGSAFHLMAYDGSSGALIGPQTTRAFNAETLWARGQAWAIYGFALAAEWTGETRYIEAATRAAARFMAELPTDGLPSWDLRLPPEADHLIDSSAAAIAAGGMLRLAAITAAHGRERLMASAYKLLEKLVTRCAEDRPEGEGLLRHGVYDMRRPLSGVDAYTVFGDYFYLETLLSVLGSAPDWWGLSSG
jgi:unsaturated chondroitin disaccharide hydrolase